MTSRTILIMAGGTGGHSFPPLAVAGYSGAGPGWRVVWLNPRWHGGRALFRPARLRNGVDPLRPGAPQRLAPGGAVAPIAHHRLVPERRGDFSGTGPDVVLAHGRLRPFPGGADGVAAFQAAGEIHEQNSIAGAGATALAAAGRQGAGGVSRSGSVRGMRGGGGAQKNRLRCLACHLSSFVSHSQRWATRYGRRRRIATAGGPFRPGGSGRLRLPVVGGSLGAQALGTRWCPRRSRACRNRSGRKVVHQAGVQHFEVVKHGLRGGQG